MPRAVVLLLLIAACAGEEEPTLLQKYQGRVEARCAEVEQGIEALLGQRFVQPVPVAIVDVAFIQDFARSLARRMIPQRRVEQAQRLAERLHQVPRGYDIVENQVRLVAVQAKGLYDPGKRRFFVVGENVDPDSRLFPFTAAHELVHAYRHMDFAYWDWIVTAVDVDADWAIALSCLVEGDATLLGRALGSMSDDPQELLRKTAAEADMLADAMVAQLDNPDLADYPLSLREMFLGRYAAGMMFAGALYNAGGLKALEDAYRRPPRSTEQVLHPSKYIGPATDEPTLFHGGDPTSALGSEWTLLLSNTMGEFDVRVHFTPTLGRGKAEQVANGWDGARYFFCGRGDATFLGIVSTWDRDVDAKAFAEAWLEWASTRDEETGEVFGDRVDTRDGLVVVKRDRESVLIADGVPLDRVHVVFRALASARRSERPADAHPAR